MHPLPFADGRHLRAHQRARDQVEAQRGQAVVVAARLEVGVDEAECQSALAVRQQVHRQKGDVVEHVDPAQRVVEFDAVEGAGLAVELQHVRQVQVAVALAHAAVAPAGLPQRRERLQLLAEPRAQRRSARVVGEDHRLHR